MNASLTPVLFALALLAGVSDRARSQAATAPILFFGDSITEGWMDAAKHASLAYPAVCACLCGASDGGG